MAGGSDFRALNQFYVVMAGRGHLCGLNQFYVGVTSRSNLVDFENLHYRFSPFELPKLPTTRYLDALTYNR